MKPWLQHLSDWEGPVCAAFNRRGHRVAVKRLFQLVSRLGDGVIWYITMALMPIAFGEAGLQTALQMALLGILSLTVYKLLKNGTHRPRPFRHHGNVQPLMPALDEFSFPSGHTLHAVGFTLVIAGNFPALAVFYGGFTVLVAMSRLVLGLHYPSDVLAGAAIGSLLAGLTFLGFA